MRLIDADALIKILEPHSMRNGAALGLHSGLIDAVIDEIRKMPTIDGWISVKDRMPDKNGQYLCWFGKNKIAKGAAIATYLEMWKSFGSLESLETYPNVTHWMPLTEPPKEEIDGNRK